MSLYSLNKDMLIKIISEVNDLKNYPTEEIVKTMNKCVLELSNRNKITSNLHKEEKRKKKRLLHGLKGLYNLVHDLGEIELVYIDFTIYDVKNNKKDSLKLHVRKSSENCFRKYMDDSYVCLDLGDKKSICLTTSPKHFDSPSDTILLVTEIAIFYLNKQIYVEAEKH